MPAALCLLVTLLFPLGPGQALALRQSYVFDGSGWGHGVGMCQYGARGMAAAGHNYQNILTYYYRGTQVSGWSCPPTIRVGLLEGMASVQLAAESGSFVLYTSDGDIPGGVVTPGGTWTVKPSSSGGFWIYRPDGTLLNGASYGSASKPLYARGSADDNVLRLPQNGNRGVRHLTGGTPLELNAYGSPLSLRAILVSGFETYLKGLDEVPGSWPGEAVKAQAVAARSYAVRAMGKHASSNFDICDEVHCQYYRGYDKEKDSGWVQAVDATSRQVLAYGGQVAQCFYSSSCGGHTDNNEDVWGGTPVPYLRGVPDPYCVDSANPHARWTVTLSREDIESRLNASPGTYIGTLYSIDLSDRTPSGRVRRATFNGSAARVTISGEQLRGLLGLRSAMVALRAENFDEYIVLANPAAEATSATVRMVSGRGYASEVEVGMPPFTRRTVHVNDFIEGEDVSVRVRAGRPIVAERAMYFNYRGTCDGGSCSPGVPALSSSWYLAEGYTAQSFDAWIVLYNPETQGATAYVDLLRQDGYNRTVQLALPPSTRLSLGVDALAEFSSCEFSARVRSTGPIAVERAMYFDSGGRKGGHTAEGAAGLSNNWYFAEGYTGEGFDTWITVGNPDDRAAAVEFRLCRPGGKENKTVKAVVAPRSRYTLHVDAHLPASEVAVFVGSDVPVVAERSMYFNYRGKAGGSCAMGSRAAASRWYLAEGYTGGDFDEYVVVGNPGGEKATVRISLMTPGGLQREIYQEIPAGARYTLLVDALLPSDDVSVLVEEVGGRAVAAERAMYFNYYGRRGGHASQGIMQPSSDWYFAEGYTGS